MYVGRSVQDSLPCNTGTSLWPVCWPLTYFSNGEGFGWPNFGSQDYGFKSSCRHNSAHDCSASLHRAFYYILHYHSMTYRIRPNNRTYPYKRTVKQFRSLQITARVVFVLFFIKAYVVGTHLNCIDLSVQFKWVPTTYAFIKKIREKKTKKNKTQ